MTRTRERDGVPPLTAVVIEMLADPDLSDEMKQALRDAACAELSDPKRRALAGRKRGRR